MVVLTVDLSPPREIPTTADDAAEVNDSVSILENGKDSAEPQVISQIGKAKVDNERDVSSPDVGVESALVNSTEDEGVRKRPRDQYITIKVKDFFGNLGLTEAQVFVIPPHTTVGEFFIDVSCRCNLELGEFDIIYQDKSFSYNLASFSEDQTLEALNLIPNPDRAYWMSLDVLRQKKRKTRPTITETLASVAEDNSAESAALSAVLDFGIHRRDFVGLKNRNMTCYLNSFIQGLWFTPEFRNALYNYVFEPTRFNRKSLCLPLQKLFLQQQFSVRDSIDTDELIKTFGWEDRETWNQHDIEELCSIFMENLTAEFKGSPLEGIIQALYFGTLDDYVKCLECGRVSQRSDDFLVIPLPIRNFGSLLANPTLEAALNSFVAYEVLDGNNMYNCSNCEKPCAAHKGLKFNRLPYILSIQLKRFEYDFIKDRRLKLNDRVAFPFLLDMNPYVENPSTDRRESLKIDLLRPSGMKGDEGRKTHSRPSISLIDPDEEEASSSKPSSEEGATGGEKPLVEQMADLVKSKGPEIYQLYGVMVHRGGINSGHYYAYIMDFERGKWFRCDDAAVRKATISDIEGAYGGDSDEDRELTSAYMLLYRRFDPELNILPYYLEEMPQHMQDMWNSTVSTDKVLHEEEELAKNTVRMSCFFRLLNSHELLEKVLAIPKTMSMEEAAVYVFTEMCPDIEPPDRKCLRLCRYDKDLCVTENSFEGCESMCIVTALRNRTPITKNEGLLLEVANESKLSQIYRPDDLIFKTHLMDYDRQELVHIEEIHANPAETVEELMTRICSQFLLKSDQCLTLVAHHSNRYSVVVGDKHPLSLFKFDRINNLYVQQGVHEEFSNVLLDFVEKFTNAEVIEINIQAPKVSAVKSDVAEEAAPPTAGDILVSGTLPSTTADSSSKGNVAEETAATTATVADIAPEAGTMDKTNIAPELSQGGSSEEGSTPQIQPVASTKKLIRSNEYYIKFTNMVFSCEEQLFMYTLRVEGQTPLYALSKRISELIMVKESDFVLYKLERNEMTELRRLTERICTIKPLDRLFVKLEHRLEDGEARMPVYLLNIGSISQPLEFIAEIVVTLKMTVDEVKEKIINHSEALQNSLSFDKTRMRVRRKARSNPSKIMRSNTKLQDVFTPTAMQTGEIYLQLLDEPCQLSEKHYCLIYRHWHPSTGILDSGVEVTIFHDHSTSLEEVILNKLRESLGIGEEVELEAAKPDFGYPWDVTPRLIQDLGWFSLTPPVKKSLFVYNDELVLFVRDKSECPKDFDYNDLEDLRPHNQLKSPIINDPPRREPGLKLNLAKSPSQ